MTKKHFIDFANEIASMSDRYAAQVTAEVVANIAIKHNGNFDRARFFTACEL